MGYPFYLFLHLVSLFIAFLTLGGITAHMLAGGNKQNFQMRKAFASIHGIAILVAFVSGFGMMAGKFQFGSSQWLYGKILCWIIIAAFPAIAYRKVLPRWGDFALLAIVAISAVALVVFKPF